MLNKYDDLIVLVILLEDKGGVQTSSLALLYQFLFLFLHSTSTFIYIKKTCQLPV